MDDKLVNQRKKHESLSGQVKNIDILLSLAIFLFSAIALLISVVPVLIVSSKQAKWTWLLLVIAGVLMAVILFFYLYKRRLQRKQMVSERELKAAIKKNQILNSVFHSLHDANSEKTRGILRYTYGKVTNWNKIDYSYNRVVYDIHEQLRSILKSLQHVVISIDPDRFNDKNVSADLICCYPEDLHDYETEIPIITPENADEGKSPWKLISSGDLSGNHKYTLDYLQKPNSFFSLVNFFGSWFANNKYDVMLHGVSGEKQQNTIKQDHNGIDVSSQNSSVENSHNGVSEISQNSIDSQKNDSADDPSKNNTTKSKSDSSTEEYHEENELLRLFLRHLNDLYKNVGKKMPDDVKSDIEKGKYFVQNVRDYENSKYNSTHKIWDGSAVGTTICVRNDNPEHVLVKAILTINTFGEPIHVPDDSKKQDISFVQKVFATLYRKKTPTLTEVYDKHCLTERDYEGLFLKQIVGIYSTLIASELSQMYIRHQLIGGKINPTTGSPISTNDPQMTGQQDSV